MPGQLLRLLVRHPFQRQSANAVAEMAEKEIEHVVKTRVDADGETSTTSTTSTREEQVPVQSQVPPPMTPAELIPFRSLKKTPNDAHRKYDNP